MTRILVCLCSMFFLINSSAAAHADSIKKLFHSVSDSVVVIQVQKNAYSKQVPGAMVSTEGVGSGVVVSKDGLIVTAEHVISASDTINVAFLNGETISAKVVGSVKPADVALIKLDRIPKGLKPARLGDSDKLATGDSIFVVGAPYGISHTLTVGHVSGKRKPKLMGGGDLMVATEFIQTDAAINQGNSGGPMFNMKGEVVGIVSRILSRSGGFEGIGFAVAINSVKKQLLDQENYWFGAEFVLVTGPMAEALNVPGGVGLLIQHVAALSPAFRMNLRPGRIPVTYGTDKIMIGGDIILSIQGIPMASDSAVFLKMRKAVLDIPDGGQLEFEVLRNGRIMTMMCTK